ncbi:MAG: hypothetical protein OXR84_01600 [Magnetovibrio sp.]|nr:hypothetical protein [Magnetovibrio sp.]
MPPLTVSVLDCPPPISPVSQVPSVAVAVCGAMSRLIQVMVSPARARRTAGRNRKPSISTTCAAGRRSPALEGVGHTPPATYRREFLQAT